MIYTVQAIIDFTDKYDKNKKYRKSDIFTISEERALELFSSDFHLVKYVSRYNTEVDSEESVDTVNAEVDSEESVDTVNAEVDSDKANNLENMSFNKLKELAEKKGLNTDFVNSKEKLKTLILENK